MPFTAEERSQIVTALQERVRFLEDTLSDAYTLSFMDDRVRREMGEQISRDRDLIRKFKVGVPA